MIKPILASDLLTKVNQNLEIAGIENVQIKMVSQNQYVVNESYVDHFNAYGLSLSKIPYEKNIFDWHDWLLWGFVGGYVTKEIID